MAAASNKLDFLLAERGPGKRQIKLVPSELISDFAAVGEDDDDGDYEETGKIGSEEEGSAESDGEKASGDESSENGDADSDADSDDSGDGEPETTAAAEDEEEEEPAPTSTLELSGAGVVCALCLNSARFPDGAPFPEVIQCDSCGIAVHESCYGVGEADSHASNASSDETEPWFCEPCTAELDPPAVSCELCPGRGGPLKRMDKGSWVHLLCALYTPKVVFVDWDLLSAVSTFEMPYKEYGRAACAACKDPLEARTGVATKCDAGMCKLSYHVTCAQSLGLLVDDSWDQHADDIAPAEQRYMLCPAHSSKDSMKAKRRKFNLMQKQGVALAARRKGVKLTERELGKLHHKAWAFQNRFQNLKAWRPSAEQRWARGFHNDARLLRRLAAKAHLLAGTTPAEFEAEFKGKFTAEMVGKVSMPPAFSADFVLYFQEREKVLAASGEKCAALAARNGEVKEAQKAAEGDLKRATEEYDAAKKEAQDVFSELDALFSALTKLGATVPSVPNPVPPDAADGAPDDDAAVQERMRKKAGKSRGGSQEASSSGNRLETHRCGKCEKSSDQHLLALCDSCGRHFHLGCLEPPLRKMPKKTAAFGWECSACAADDDDDEDEEEPDLEAPRAMRPKNARKPVNHLHNDPSIFYRGKGRKSRGSNGTAGKKRGRLSAGGSEEPPPKRSKTEPLKVDVGGSGKRRGRPAKSSPASPILDLNRKPKTKAEARAMLAQAKSASHSPKAPPQKTPPKSPTKASAAAALKRAKAVGMKRGAAAAPAASPSISEPNLEEEAPLVIAEAPETSAEVVVSTSRDLKRRMQYPLANLDRAVAAVLDGRMGAKKAAEAFHVPRSTIGRRVSVIQSSASPSPSKSGVKDTLPGPAKAGSLPTSPAKPKRRGLSMDERLREEMADFVAAASSNGASAKEEGKEDWEEDDAQLSLAQIAGAHNGGTEDATNGDLAAVDGDGNVIPKRNKVKLIRVEDLDL